VAFAVSMGGNYNFFDRQGGAAVAKVGSIEISQQRFQRVYQRTIESLSARAGRRLTTQEAQALGLPDRVLQGLLQDTALDVEAHKLGLGLSKNGLAQSITSNELFQDPPGKFNPEKYHQFLQRIGYSAPGFEDEYKSDLIRRQLRGIFDKSGIVPKVMLEAYNRYANEQRIINYFDINSGAAGPIDSPSEDVLKSYYENHKAQFMSPELRDVSVIAISPQTAASQIQVSEDDIKAEYAAKAANYAVPERRKIELIPYQTPKAAAAAYAILKGGENFLEAAKKAGFKQSDIDLGLVSKKEFAEKFATNASIINAAFSLSKGQVSEPVDGPLSTVIMRVQEIVPGEEKSFDEVKDRVRDDLTKARAAAESARLIKAFENDRTSGKPIDRIAEDLHIPIEKVTLDRTGNGPDGKPVKLSFVPVSALAAAAFKSGEGVENEALRLSGGGYAWFEVQKVQNVSQKLFDDVKADVEAMWRNDQIRTKLTEKARDLVSRIDHGEAIADAAKSVGAQVKTSKSLKRDGSEGDLSSQAVSQAFSLAEGSASSASVNNGTSRVVFHVEKVVTPSPLNEADAKALVQQLQSQVSDDNFIEFLSEIVKSAGVSVDRKNLTAAAGANYDSDE
jgi:peptidyl-prolyl cis-trans isomerase D